MVHCYNEFDPDKAAWLRELMKAGPIVAGEVDERDIQDIAPDDLRRFGGVHLFAGIGIWSYALRLAGWPDDRPVWTCSCPCQPFSTAGKGEGFADERHLWPAAFHLLSECRPVVCFGEQVASDDGLAWLDLVQADLESVGYTVGTVVTPAAGYGAPHGRHRIYWVAHTAGERRPKHKRRKRARKESDAEDLCESGSLADSESGGRGEGRSGQAIKWPLQSDRPRKTGELGHANGTGSLAGRAASETARHGGSALANGSVGVAQGDTNKEGLQRGNQENLPGERRRIERRGVTGPGPTGGFWGDADWLHCAPEPGYPEGRWRPVEPGTFPLAHGAAARVVRLRGYGDAIVAPQAATFIKAFLDVTKQD